MRGKGINYDTGFCPGGRSSREDFDSEVVRRELGIIAGDLHCNAVRISGGDPDRLSVAGQHAVAAGWTIVDRNAEPPRLNGEYQRDEGEQVAYLRELLAIFEEAGLDGAFWFTFAGYGLPHRADPRYDLDMASYGVVKVLEQGRGSDYPDMRWEPKASFRALAAAYAG